VNACDVAGPIVDRIEKALTHLDLPPSFAEMMCSRHAQVEYKRPDVIANID